MGSNLARLLALGRIREKRERRAAVAELEAVRAHVRSALDWGGGGIVDASADPDEWSADECEPAPADAWRVVSDRRRVGKREYRCDQCGRSHAPGDTMRVLVTRFEGELHSTRTCADGCASRGIEAIETDWRDAVGGSMSGRTQR